MIDRVSHPGVKVVIDRVPDPTIEGETLFRLYPWRLRTSNTSGPFNDRVVFATYHRTWFDAFSTAHARLTVDSMYKPEGWARFWGPGAKAIHVFGWACMHCHEVTSSPLGHHKPRHGVTLLPPAGTDEPWHAPALDIDDD